MGTIINNTNKLSPMEHNYKMMDNVIDNIKYNLEHLVFNNHSYDQPNCITTTIDKITCLEYKQIPNIDGVVYLIKALIKINDDTKCCHLRVTHHAATDNSYKIDRYLADMKTGDELAYLDI